MADDNKLKRRIVVEEAMPKQKKGNAFVGFLFVMLFVLIIAGIIYLLESKGYIDIFKFI
ncbi:MAG: hypothetical protein ACI4VT_02090 [Bacilli bacterium]|nr:hypothetical protein [bacterium]MDY3757549.1 hypothetical protein [Bacilli bacterium]